MADTMATGQSTEVWNPEHDRWTWHDRQKMPINNSQ